MGLWWMHSAAEMGSGVLGDLRKCAWGPMLEGLIPFPFYPPPAAASEGAGRQGGAGREPEPRFNLSQTWSTHLQSAYLTLSNG